MFAFVDRSVSAYAGKRDLRKADVVMANGLWRILGSKRVEGMQEPAGAECNGES